MAILSITDLPVKGKRILMRLDFNVPIDKKGHIVDDTRITASLESIKYAIDNGASVILMSHLGRPKGHLSKEFSLAPVAKHLEEIIGVKVIFAPDCIGPKVEELAKNLKPGEILLLENLRFHNAEEHPEEDPSFAKQLASLGDFYVNDAFGSSHRAHSSIVDITRYFPGKAAAGFLLQREIFFLGNALKNPKRPFYAIIGGAKISSKLGILKSLLNKVDALFIGGGMAYTFYKTLGYEIGDSIYESDLIPEAQELLTLAKEKEIPVYLPIDNIVVEEISEKAIPEVSIPKDGIPNGECGVDIGPATIDLFRQKLKDGKTILWNGPLGVCEIQKFSEGTKAIAEAISLLDAVTIVGGGDSIAALQAIGYADEISHISTGGGATLEYIEFGTLPGIESLSHKS